MKYQTIVELCPPELLRAQHEVFKCPVLSDQQTLKRCSKNFGEAGTRDYLVFLLEK